MTLDEIQEKFKGKWKLNRSENFEDFMREVGFNFFTRQVAKRAKPVQQITVDCHSIKIALQTGFWTKTFKLLLDEDVEVSYMWSRSKVKTKYENGQLVEYQTPCERGAKPQTIYRDILDGELLMTIHVGNIICKRWFHKMKD